MKAPKSTGKAATKTKNFRGGGFCVQIPEDWVDLTIYTLIGPSGAEEAPWLRVVTDSDVTTAQVGEYAEQRIHGITQATPGIRLLVRKEAQLQDGRPAVQAVFRWRPTDDIRLYQSYQWALNGGVGLTLFSQLSKRGRAIIGPTVDKIMLSLRPSNSDSKEDSQEEEWQRLTSDAFALDLPPGWSDKTVHTLAEPDASQFRRNLVVQREALEGEPESLEEYAAAEKESLGASAPGFELENEQEATVADGDSAYSIVFQRSTKNGGTVVQTQLFAWRDETIYTLTLTTEPNPPKELCEQLSGIPLSFGAQKRA